MLKNLIQKPRKILKLEFQDISNILKSAREILEKEGLLLEFNNIEPNDEIYVIGDIHGNLQTLIGLIKLINKNNPKHVIFLGDLVDRGPAQLECLFVVLSLKVLFPNRYYLLKGNHETLEMNKYYGFYQEFIERYPAQNTFNEILTLYDAIPICAIINETILCLHGGIPEDLEVLNKLRSLKRENIDNDILKSITSGIFQIMWNDPKSEIKGFSESYRGEGIKFFGRDVFDKFMKTNNLKYLIRAHECFPEGYKWFFNDRLLSIFSSANYRGIYFPNPASYAIIKNNKVIPKIIESLHY
ncbi:MAG: metallophosphoesterase [Promethearchaeota archaeon]